MVLPLTVAAALLLAFFLFTMIRGLLGMRRFVWMGPELRFPAPSPKPKVSVLVPARNEEEIVGGCLRSILAQDYPNFEVVAVDDDSTDRTGAILEELRREEPSRLRVLSVRGDLPPNWIGKHYALTLAAGASRGEWLLLTDADILFEREALSRAVEFALHEGCDLLSLLPKPLSAGFWERLVLPVFGVLLGVVFPLADVNHPRRRTALAAGGFILIRRAVFDAVGGYAPAADHIVDDVLMAKRVKERGFATRLAAGEKLLRTRMYRGAADLWEGIGKSAAAALDFRFLLFVASLVFLLVMALLPVAGLVSGVLWWKGALPEEWKVFAGLAVADGTLLLLLHVRVNRTMEIPLPLALLYPLGYLFYLAALISSFFRARFGRGVEWKGRRYYGAGRGLPRTKIGV